MAPEEVAIDDATTADFVARHGLPRFGPVTIVIPSYGEAANIERVLAEVPKEIHGMATSAVVVVDGRHPDEEEGATARRVEAVGHFVAVAPVNRGQGAALRVAYRLAREGGARYIVSLDADGQYDPREIPRLLEPILGNEADFVSGSRRLGTTEHYDAVRNAGVDVYAWVITILTLNKITDPANGLRAMRAELTADVPLTEPQYQASELEVGAIMRGWRVTERANTMRRRGSGKSKKQHNLMYALQFGRVVTKTWLRGLGPAARRARRARRAALRG
ncbi:MAG TPA: glycosyltransferase family 2 protein [Thermoleophilaceae bacterium]|nr:glycosyltransferase family 2 protein [Thermoleophilaceae bacterium]